MPLTSKRLRALVVSAAVILASAVVIPAVVAAGAQAPAPRLSGTPQLHAVTGKVGAGRPTFYVTFRTARAVTGVNGARNLMVEVSGSSGCTFTAVNPAPGAARTCFRAGFRPYQRTPAPRRLRPGVSYRVTFALRSSLDGERTTFATRKLRARSFAATPQSSTPSPCRR